MKRWLVFTLLCLVAACGQKGPLYFAPPEDIAAEAAPAETDDSTRGETEGDINDEPGSAVDGAGSILRPGAP